MFIPVGAGPTIGADGAHAIIERLAPRWVVPMHYRTPRVNFLEPADAFVDSMPHAHRLDGPAFETSELPTESGQVVVVPAVP